MRARQLERSLKSNPLVRYTKVNIYLLLSVFCALEEGKYDRFTHTEKVIVLPRFSDVQAEVPLVSYVKVRKERAKSNIRRDHNSFPLRPSTSGWARAQPSSSPPSSSSP